ncbi:SDR family oxidoreductase [Roseospira marina]|uniref:SDR family oxidoreductase n=1 Tax=Roseospira marina TaxID=140057 RepID=A0A5M6IH01_9PROT|nr:SDR family oxidoreductase [Roseospira marina]KAA5607581.1 SDR family oxidoreductase [Roseospira marina]MBB4312227.1 3-oxoacyl-[acyl-carrier protein] reductase [Roseospira marina]MBB5085757.1 3-oxoacyl-[acyl-carrier protein] reductase [Roseospira marina]
MDLGLTGKKALVLASSRGLGLGIAEALAAEGTEVLLTGRDAEALAANAAAINARGAGTAHWVASDLSDAGFVEQIAAAAEATLGRVDILVNNTGGPPPGPATAMDEATLAAQAQAMVFHVIALTNRLLPAMQEAGWGRVLTCASSGVLQPIPNLALSNTLRGALVGWNKTLANEVAASGVTCNMLLPGRVHTDRVDQLDAAAAKRTGKDIDAVREGSRATIPAGRYGTVAEFGAVAAFLCSGPASYMTGSVIRCDGGAIKSV